MVTDEILKKLKDNAWKIINEDERRGVTVTLAMDPVVVFAITSELLRMRKMQPEKEIAEEAGDDHGSE